MSNRCDSIQKNPYDFGYNYELADSDSVKVTNE